MNVPRKIPFVLINRKNIAFVWILLSLLISGLAWTFFSYEKQILSAKENSELKEVATLKINQIEEWRKEKLADAQMFSKSPFFSKALNEWAITPSNLNLKKEILERLILINWNESYNDIVFTDCKGNALLSTSGATKKLEPQTVALVIKAVQQKQIIFTDIYKCSALNTLQLDYIAPVFNSSNGITGTLIFIENANEQLFPLIDQHPVFSNTFETVLVKRDKDSVLFLNQLQHSGRSAMSVRVPTSQTNEVSVKAVSGNVGFYEGVNYLGRSVVAYMAPIKGTSWFLVAKINKDELYAPLYLRGKITFALTLLLLLTIALGLAWYFNYLKRYIYFESLNKEKSLAGYYKEFFTVLYSIGDGVITTDVIGNVKRMNAVAEKLTGHSIDEAAGKPIEEIFNIINESSRKPVENPIQQVLKRDIVVGLANHTILIGKDGAEIPIADSASPIRDEHGLMQGVVLVFRDKSKEHLSEKKVRESEARLQRAEVTAMSGNWEIHLTDGKVDASEGACKIYGTSAENLTIEKIQQFPLPQFRPLLNEALEMLVKEGVPYNVEFKIKTPDGKIKEIHSIAEYDQKENVIFGVFQDITARKELENKHFHLQQIIDNSLNEVYFFNAKTLKFEYLNKGALLNLGYSYEEALELTAIDIKPEFTRESFTERLKPLLDGTMEKLEYETFHRRKNGSLYPVEAHLQYHKTDGEGVFFAITNNITQRKSAEQKLLQSQERWKNLFENSPSAIAIYTAVDNGNDFVFTDFNRVAQEIDSIDRDKVVGKRISELFPSAEGLGFLEVFRRVMKTGKTEHIDATVYKDNRIQGWRENIIYRLNTGEIVALYNDVTARMKAEQELRESEQKFKSLFKDHSAVKLLIEPKTGKIVDASNSAAEFYGWPLETIKQMSIYDINVSTKGEIEDRIHMVLNQDQDYFELKHRKADGQIRDVEIFSSKVGFHQNQYLYSIIHDVTEARKAIRQLRLLSRSVEQNPVSIVITDQSGNIEYVNPKFSTVTGYSFDEVVGKNPRVLKSGIQPLSFYQSLWTTILSGKVWSGEICNKRKDGTQYWEKAIISSVEDEQGTISHFVAVKEDITESKKMQEDLISALQKAEENDRLKSAFLANMSHEIRTPMNGILGFTELLKSPTLLQAKRLEFVKIVEQSGKRLLGIINDLIDIAKIESRQMEIFVSEVNVSEEVTNLTAFFKPEADTKEIAIIVQDGSQLPELVIATDKQKFLSIVTNLLKNAIKFTETGSIRINMSIGPKMVEFLVEDTGIGIPTEMLKKVFDRFVQGDTSLSRSYEGAGLGLTITKSYVEMLGGTIEVQSEEGKGTRFSFSLPLTNAGHTAPSTKDTAALKTANVEQKLNILVVEDDKISAQFLHDILQPFAAQLLFARTGGEAVKLCRENSNVNLVLMDIKMPDMDGLEATRIIRTFNKEVVIIAQTAYALTGDREKTINAGCNEYLTKPLSRRELTLTIEKLFKNTGDKSPSPN
ncbi:MAG TPA: PAS domain S-box protein [Williamwhitmania sp.]|nr:PAS domain S-box protein [Williamwhitmania sp.]